MLSRNYKKSVSFSPERDVPKNKNEGDSVCRDKHHLLMLMTIIYCSKRLRQPVAAKHRPRLRKVGFHKKLTKLIGIVRAIWWSYRDWPRKGTATERARSNLNYFYLPTQTCIGFSRLSYQQIRMLDYSSNIVSWWWLYCVTQYSLSGMIDLINLFRVHNRATLSHDIPGLLSLRVCSILVLSPPCSSKRFDDVLLSRTGRALSASLCSPCYVLLASRSC